jgi:hypothetical protein
MRYTLLEPELLKHTINRHYPTEFSSVIIDLTAISGSAYQLDRLAQDIP